jgi:hypothetical protein
VAASAVLEYATLLLQSLEDQMRLHVAVIGQHDDVLAIELNRINVGRFNDDRAGFPSIEIDVWAMTSLISSPESVGIGAGTPAAMLRAHGGSNVPIVAPPPRMSARLSSLRRFTLMM